MAEDEVVDAATSLQLDRKRKLQDAEAEAKKLEIDARPQIEMNADVESDGIKVDDVYEGKDSLDDAPEGKRRRQENETVQQDAISSPQEQHAEAHLEGVTQRSSAETTWGAEDDIRPLPGDTKQTVNGQQLPLEDAHEMEDGQPPSVEDVQQAGYGHYLVGDSQQLPETQQMANGLYPSIEDSQETGDQKQIQVVSAQKTRDVGRLAVDGAQQTGDKKLATIEGSLLVGDVKALPVECTQHVGDGKQLLVEGVKQVGDDSLPHVEDDQMVNTERRLLMEDIQQDESAQLPISDHEQSDGGIPVERSYSSLEHPNFDNQPTSRKIEVPNNKVGVLIGKAGDTIRFLQYNSGAKIQITRDVDSDPYSSTRSVELFGPVESINKAEQLIKDVIAEADAGGSPSLVARGFGTAQAGSEQIQIQVPNEKVGLIIGKGGETIKNLQTRSGARIQLIPQHLDSDQSKERTIRVSGSKKQIDIAREMIKEVMNQIAQRSSSLSGGYAEPVPRPRGSSGLHQWGAQRGLMPQMQSNYDYHQQRGTYSSQAVPYPQSYGGYYQQPPPRSGFSSGWDQRPSATMLGSQSHGGGFDYYAHSGPPPNSVVSASGPAPTQSTYNYGQPQVSDYGQTPAYSQQVPPQQTYEGQPPNQQSYGSSHPVYTQQASSGYGQSYGRPSYGMPSSQTSVQSYGPPRIDPTQYQVAPVSSAHSYGSAGVHMQQQFPYMSAVPTIQQPYVYGQPAGTSEGYSQLSSAPMTGYSQPAGNVYNQSGGMTQPPYAQGVQTGSYGQYPSQQGYSEQQAQVTACYSGYQGSGDTGYTSGPAPVYGPSSAAQGGYVQPASNVTGYDQSIAQSGYGTHAGSAPPGGYTKSLSPQQGYAQYDTNQSYGQGQH